jgi:hypothetical protein
MISLPRISFLPSQNKRSQTDFRAHKFSDHFIRAYVLANFTDHKFSEVSLQHVYRLPPKNSLSYGTEIAQQVTTLPLSKQSVMDYTLYRLNQRNSLFG